MRGPEGKIQDAVTKYARFRGILVKKQEVGRYFIGSGWPDVIMFGRARFGVDAHTVFMEFKAPGKSLTPLQEKRKKEIQALGFMYLECSSVEQGKTYVDREFA